MSVLKLVAHTTKADEPLTFERLSALYDYLKPERLEIENQTIEIHGFNIHREHNPPGIIVLTEKRLPDDKVICGGKLIILDLNSGKAIVYDPPDGVI